MKLFSSTLQEPQSISIEQFLSYSEHSEVIANEALTDYLYKTKDLFVNSFNTITNKYNDKVVRDVISTKYETLHKLKRIKFSQVDTLLISKPENFDGFFTDYIIDLKDTTNDVNLNIETTLHKLKSLVGFYINEYKEDKVNISTASSYFKEVDNDNKQHTKTISSYFKHTNGLTKGYLKKHLRTLSDIEVLYKDIESFSYILTEQRIKQINKEVKDIVEYIDMLISNNLKNHGKLINDKVKKDLTFSIYTTAKQIELLSYLYSNAYTFYGTFYNNVLLLNDQAE